MRVFVLLLAVLAGEAQADTPRKDFPLVAVSKSETCFITMLPGKYRIGPDDKVTVLREPLATIYRLRDDGAMQKLWQMKGRYTFRPHLSDDCRYLALMEYGFFGKKPEPYHFGVQFFDRGKLLARHAVGDLVKDHSKLSRSVSHYGWLSHPGPVRQTPAGDWEDTGKYDSSAEVGPRYGNTFTLKTVDGIRYEFDMTTGKIKSP